MWRAISDGALQLLNSTSTEISAQDGWRWRYGGFYPMLKVYHFVMARSRTEKEGAGATGCWVAAGV